MCILVCLMHVFILSCHHSLILVLVLIYKIYIVYNKKTGKPRGYAFIEYEHERDMHCE